MSMPKPLQERIDEDLKLAEWRAAQAEALRSVEPPSTIEVVKLTKNGKPAKRRGPKPQVVHSESENDSETTKIEKVIKKQRKNAKGKTTVEPYIRRDMRGQLKKPEFVVDSLISLFEEDFGNDFLEHLRSRALGIRRQRNKTAKALALKGQC
jgi:hypothetical protein